MDGDERHRRLIVRDRWCEPGGAAGGFSLAATAFFRLGGCRFFQKNWENGEGESVQVHSKFCDGENVAKKKVKVRQHNRETAKTVRKKTGQPSLPTPSPDHEETTSEQLFRHLFRACNILRGPINQDEYKSYVSRETVPLFHVGRNGRYT